MIPFEKTKLGKTGLMIPNLGLGTAPLSGDSLAGGLYGGSAEENAIKMAGKNALGSTMYITLEPCNIANNKNSCTKNI